MAGAKATFGWRSGVTAGGTAFAACALALALWPESVHARQIAQQPAAPGATPRSSPLDTAIDPMADVPSANLGRVAHAQEKAQSSERYLRMVKDSDRLLQLATQLKAEVDKSTRNELPVGAFQKADEIERLAHDVKQRIKD